jgi:D-serine deaminase-like pyridoxal phosphate-dependent protein
MTEELIGRSKADLDTPALCVDLDALDANIARMAEYLRQRGKQWRPHAKGHKTPAIAKQQLAAGAIGVTVAKASEAEVYGNAGIRDILIANMIVGGPKLERVAALCRWADPIVAVDHFAQTEALADVCRRRGVTCRVIIEVNIGFNRVGIRPGSDFRDLSRGVAGLKGVRLAGIMGYEGHLLTVPDRDEKRERIVAAMALLVEQRDQLARDGLNCDIVSASGTGSFQISADCPGITEVQAGGVIFADPAYTQQCGLEGFLPALSVLVTVTSRPKLERAITDAGRKTMNWELERPRIKGTVEGRPLPDAVIAELHAEHGLLALGPESQDLRIGDKIEVAPGYSDWTVMLHDWMYGIRGGRVEAVWPIEARGKLQ